MQINHEYHFKTAEELYDYTIVKGHIGGAIYDYSETYVKKEIDKFYEMIKKLNTNIENYDEQLLPSYPYTTREIDGCLSVISSEISVDTIKNRRGIICVGGSGWNTKVLHL